MVKRSVCRESTLKVLNIFAEARLPDLKKKTGVFCFSGWANLSAVSGRLIHDCDVLRRVHAGSDIKSCGEKVGL